MKLLNEATPMATSMKVNGSRLTSIETGGSFIHGNFHGSIFVSMEVGGSFHGTRVASMEVGGIFRGSR